MNAWESVLNMCVF